MLVKRPDRSKPYFTFIKGIIFFELVAFGTGYVLWNRMNHSRDFRYYLHNHFPSLLHGFYTLGKEMNEHYKLDEADLKVWKLEGKIE